MTASDRFSARDTKLLAALLLGANLRQAAQHAGCSERTVRRKLQEPRFRAELKQAEDQAIAAVRRRLIHAGTLAIDRLVAAMDDQAVPAAARVSAMRALASMAVDRLLPTQVELGGQVTVHQPDATPIIEKVRRHLADIQAARAETDPAALETLMAEPATPNGNGHHP